MFLIMKQSTILLKTKSAGTPVKGVSAVIIVVI